MPGHTVTGWPRRARPAHADRPWPRYRPAALVVAAVAAFGAVALGAASCLATGEPSRSAPTSASLITVTPAVDTTRTSP